MKGGTCCRYEPESEDCPNKSYNPERKEFLDEVFIGNLSVKVFYSLHIFKHFDEFEIGCDFSGLAHLDLLYKILTHLRLAYIKMMDLPEAKTAPPLTMNSRAFFLRGKGRSKTGGVSPNSTTRKDQSKAKTERSPSKQWNTTKRNSRSPLITNSRADALTTPKVAITGKIWAADYLWQKQLIESDKTQFAARLAARAAKPNRNLKKLEEMYKLTSALEDVIGDLPSGKYAAHLPIQFIIPTSKEQFSCRVIFDLTSAKVDRYSPPEIEINMYHIDLFDETENRAVYRKKDAVY